MFRRLIKAMPLYFLLVHYDAVYRILLLDFRPASWSSVQSL